MSNGPFKQFDRVGGWILIGKTWCRESLVASFYPDGKGGTAFKLMDGGMVMIRDVPPDEVVVAITEEDDE